MATLERRRVVTRRVCDPFITRDSIREMRKRRSEVNREKDSRYLKFDNEFDRYLDDVERCTKRKMSKHQRVMIRKAIESKRFTRLSPKKSHAHRSKFNKNKQQMIEDWEKHYGEKWPTYSEPVYSKKGKVVRYKAARYDVHELIFNSWGSPHEWWNAWPAKFPSEHQNDIHRKGGNADRIFG
jgi:predicted ribonuclease toxin of YeeF-YezG toxin-antitoxin module